MENATKGVSTIQRTPVHFSAYDEEQDVSFQVPSPRSMMRTVAGVPAYNEENTIASVVLKAKKYVDEVVVVDDGSDDNTTELAEEAGATVIKHGENKGYGASLATLIHYARENDVGVLVFLDGDGQHPEHEIPKLVEKVLKNEADVALGSRFLDSEHEKKIPRYRKIGIKVLTRLSTSNMSYIGPNGEEKRITDGQSGFRAFSRKALEKVNPRETGMGASAEILMEIKEAGLTVQEVPISVSYEGDTSTENPIQHGLGVIGSIIRYVETKHSLLSFGVPGLIAFLLGIFMGVRTVQTYNEIGVWPIGHVFVTVLLFFGGLTAGMTGIILHAIINAHKRGYG